MGGPVTTARPVIASGVDTTTKVEWLCPEGCPDDGGSRSR